MDEYDMELLFSSEILHTRRKAKKTKMEMLQMVNFEDLCALLAIISINLVRY